jgi:RNA polymerase sigma-70 factor, ECF subfamily
LVSRSSNPVQVSEPRQPPSPASPAEKELSCFAAFERELDYLRRTLRRLGVQHADIEDELHEVFLVLNRNWSKYDHTRPLRPYLFGITFRVVAGRLRKWRREISQPVEEFAPDSQRGPEATLESERARALVLAALSHVPLKRRAVLVMHDIDELAMPDIARSLEIPLFTGYSRLRRAREEFEAAVRALRHEMRS